MLPVPDRRTAGTPLAGPARAATVGSLTAVAAVVAVEVAVGWGDLAWVPLVAGLLLGLPHGAVDHLLPGRLLRWPPARSAAFALAYAGVAAVAWLLFRAFPGPALLVFVVLSAWHFGTGETAFADLRAGRPVQRQVTASVVLGALVLLVPLVRGQADAAPVVSAVVPGWDGLLPPAVTTAVLVTVLPAAAALATERLLSGRWLEAAEVGVLLVLVLVVPPFAAFGVWFGAWHAPRHGARVLAGDPASAADLAAGRLGAPLRRFAAAAAAPTAAVLAVLALLWSATDGWTGLLVTLLPLLAALTLPHALVVAWLDRASGAGGQIPGTAPAARARPTGRSTP
ncbi:Brp/Blh family beta-carotene 15,15'-dioxygenase [Geodermatophilus nigrescens]|uniref:Probable beta-carotene 15,15'-dioxygenase n=1 Tax=Geodermatophilus nigrescens TaxID=1070870 RepID=A0A1M5IPP6_9ACTN|nr:Brp/Blh family beta-carotene 15,15'-dioxygenase [Geodermatophilus nigrescens]SHG30267.1 beta-carotene 15,15'-monooxygenase, Brp/Blh family [Geodermatophilus nigrescens]